MEEMKTTLVLFSYYFLTALNFRPPPFVAKCITIGQIAQFFMSLYGLVYVVYAHFMMEVGVESSQIDCGNVERELFRCHVSSKRSHSSSIG